MSDFQRKKKINAAILAIMLLSIMATISQSQWFVSLELKTVDARMRWHRGNLAAPRDIVLILIDDASLDSMQAFFGRWPWPRTVIADLIEFLSGCGAKALLVDILFTEKQQPAESGAILPKDDQALVSATANSGNVFHSAQFHQDREDDYNRSALNRPLPADFIHRFAYKHVSDRGLRTANIYYIPFQELYQASVGIGVVSITPDIDGVFRKTTPLVQYGPNLYPALSLAPFLMAGGIDLGDDGDIALTLPDTAPRQVRLPIDSSGNFFINMYGKFEAYSFSGVYVSLMKIRQGILADLPVSPEVFADKIVFIGASAAGVEDLKHTALGSNTPGVYLHASAYGNIAANDMLRFAPVYVQPVMMSGMIVLAIAAVFFFERLPSKIIWTLSAVLAWSAACVGLFSRNICLPMAGVPLSALCAYVVSLSFLSFSEGRERRKIKNVLGQYVAPVVLAKVLENSKEEFMRAEVGSKEELTIFFSDIRGFTSLAEAHPVETVVELLNGYLSAMTDIIFDNHGTLDKFIGDAIVAFWGAPLRDDKHPSRAVRSALAMQSALIDLNRENNIRHLPQLNVGIGIHTDQVILGNIGSHRKLDYTVIGDGVNLTSRLEGLTKMYNAPILISQSTYERVMGEVCCRVVDYVKVKGKKKPIRIYSVLGTPASIDSTTMKVIDLTESAFDHYTQKKFSRAEEILEQILALKPNDFLATMLLYRCREFRRDPPPEDWDGYYEYHTK